MATDTFKFDTISAKNLGAFAMPGACPKCLWMKARLGFNAPWSIFPGIFSTIDSFSKGISTLHIKSGTKPQWMQKCGAIKDQLPCPHWSKFSFKDEASGMTLRGSPDELFRLDDGTIAILDYKTSKFTDHQDDLLPMYQTQLGAYKWLARMTKLGETSLTALVYFEPDPAGAVQERIVESGFQMQFNAHVLPVKTDIDEVLALLKHAKEHVALPVPPPSKAKCKDCALVEKIVGIEKMLEMPA